MKFLIKSRLFQQKQTFSGPLLVKKVRTQVPKSGPCCLHWFISTVLYLGFWGKSCKMVSQILWENIKYKIVRNSLEVNNTMPGRTTWRRNFTPRPQRKRQKYIPSNGGSEFIIGDLPESPGPQSVFLVRESHAGRQWTTYSTWNETSWIYHSWDRRKIIKIVSEFSFSEMSPCRFWQF